MPDWSDRDAIEEAGRLGGLHLGVGCINVDLGQSELEDWCFSAQCCFIMAVDHPNDVSVTGAVQLLDKMRSAIMRGQIGFIKK